MNRLYSILLLSILLCTFSCDKVYINGDLDGMWKLSQLQDLDSIIYPEDIYYSFQRHMVQIGKYHEEDLPKRYLGTFIHKNDSLTISGFREYLNEEKKCSIEELAHFALYDTFTIFRIEHLTGEKLILSTDTLKYYFNKW